MRRHIAAIASNIERAILRDEIAPPGHPINPMPEIPGDTTADRNTIYRTDGEPILSGFAAGDARSTIAAAIQTGRVDWRNADLRGLDLSHIDFRHADLSHARLDSAILENTSFDGASLIGSCLAYTRGNKASFAAAAILKSDFRNASLPGANFNDAFISGCLMRQISAPHARLHGTTICHSDFDLANFRNIQSHAATIRNTSMSACDLTYARMTHCDASALALQFTCLDHATLTGTSADRFIGIDLVSNPNIDIAGIQITSPALDTEQAIFMAQDRLARLHAKLPIEPGTLFSVHGLGGDPKRGITLAMYHGTIRISPSDNIGSISAGNGTTGGRELLRHIDYRSLEEALYRDTRDRHGTPASLLLEAVDHIERAIRYPEHKYTRQRITLHVPVACIQHTEFNEERDYNSHIFINPTSARIVASTGAELVTCGIDPQSGQLQQLVPTPGRRQFTASVDPVTMRTLQSAHAYCDAAAQAIPGASF